MALEKERRKKDSEKWEKRERYKHEGRRKGRIERIIGGERERGV